MVARLISFPETYSLRLAASLNQIGYDFEKTSALASAIKQLSDFYLANPEGETPWEKPWAQAAYLAYFFPLNYLRVAAVISEGKRLGFFDTLTGLIDFGSGVGTVGLAFADLLPGHFRTAMAIERSALAVKWHKTLRESADQTKWLWASKYDASHDGSHHRETSAEAERRLTAFSYSLTELNQLPLWAKTGTALMLIEPATHQDSRRLLSWRTDLTQSGWFAWAPCTHQRACPLLTESARDWCHDRIQVSLPPWMEEVESFLPMKNPTLAFSYLLLRRDPPPQALGALARLTGDLRKEKGASRQMVCRGPEREFLSWQHRFGEPPEYPRGALVRLPEQMAKKSNELRPNPEQSIEWVTDLV